MISNILLDFLSRDSRQLSGLFDNTWPERHVTLLNQAINIAVFLCGEYCIVPPGFLAEDPIVREAVSRCSDYFMDRLIRMPLADQTLESFFKKKSKEYRWFRTAYSGVYDPDNLVFLRTLSDSLISRSSNVALEIIKQWEEGPDTPGIWRQLIDSVSPAEIERIRQIPRSLREQGIAILWPAVGKRIGNRIGSNPIGFRYVVHNNYFNVYKREYMTRVVTSLPFLRVSFGLETGDLRYDYEALKGALGPIGLWKLLRSMSPASLIRLRTKYGYHSYRSVFDRISKRCNSAREVEVVYSRAAELAKPAITETRILDKFDPVHLELPFGLTVSNDEIDAVALRLDAVSESAVEAFEEIATQRVRESGNQSSESEEASGRIGIFVALRMERDILTRYFKLRSSRDRVYTGRIGTTEVVVFGPNEMGRVPAAVATMAFLRKYRPELIIVAGIAGGFAEEGTELGDVIVATNIVDLATRKVQTDSKQITVQEFRPREYRTDKRFVDYLSYAFNSKAWESQVTDDLDWPDGRRPTIRYGAMASLDEVVSNSQWVDSLLKAWPKLLGVEMEAGGVCAAAEDQNARVAVLRGVSDLADPAKSDTAWRKLAMRTVCHLLSNLDYEEMLN